MDYRPQNPEYPPQEHSQYQQPQWQQAPQWASQERRSPTSEKRWLTAYLLFASLGLWGVHRFYVGKIGTGVLQLLTFGGFGIWLLIDYILLITGDFTDYNGQVLYREPIAGGNKSWVATVILCAFLGSLGIHRFYTGKIGSGIAQLLTFGGLGVWTAADYILIIMGEFKDSDGMLLNRPR